MNAEQCLAIRRSLGSDTAFVWGPPGTGKTTTLARIVEAHYLAGKSVLLVSNTNIAVDTALEKVAERLKGEPEFHKGAVLRQGPVVKDELRQRFGPQVILEAVVARLGDRLGHEKENLKQQVGALQRDEKALAQAVSEHERLEGGRRRLEQTQTSLTETKGALKAREKEAQQHRARVASLRANLERARTMGTLRRLVSGLKPERLQQEIRTAESAVEAAVAASRALADDLVKCETSVRDLTNEWQRLAGVVACYPPLPECQAKLQTIRDQLREANDRITAIDQELAALTEEVLGRCRVLATTVYRTYLGTQKSRLFDVAVIDEASMLMLPLAYYAAGLADQSVIVAGDFRQLPPIVTSDEPLAEEWLKRDVFEKVGIPERVQQRSETPELVALRTQYRMEEPICAVVSDFFYQGHLLTDLSSRQAPPPFPLGKAPLLYVDTSHFHPWTALRLGTYSRYNLFHALLVRNIVLHLAEVGYLPGTERTSDAVGAVAPYGAQSKLIQALLEDRLGARAAGIAATVHRFQGNEKNVMLLDLTDSFGTKLSHFLAATRIEEDGARLLNVALSRARHHLVVVANFDYLRAQASDDTIVRRLLDRFQERGEPLDADALLPLADRDWIDGLHRLVPAGFDMPDGAAGAFTEGTFYPAFLRDLASARASIVIFSPFATETGTGRWVDVFRATRARGVAARIVTRPPDDAGTVPTEEVAELIDELRTLGIAVDLRARMNEKIAIMDGEILWHGSLNILSHRDTHESMLRIKSASACMALGRFVSAPTGRKEDQVVLHDPENPTCPRCNRPTIWHHCRYRIFYVCEDPHCDGKVVSRGRGQRRSSAAGGQRSGGRPCPQLGCSGRLVERNGRHGRFLGCTAYPRCRYTEVKK